MAENRQSGSPGIFGDKAPGDSELCARCEAMLTDALDGTLSAAELEFFDLHASACGPCGQLVADARRGAAWLEMLRTPAPEPPTDLLGRILAQTGDSAGMVPAAMQHPGYGLEPAAVAGVSTHGNVIPFPRRMVAAVRHSGLGQIVLQPRLAMTAAMAFFSVALTMNLTGFHPTSLRVSDLQPSSLRRDFYSADARVTQHYEGLRVVYELESRVHDLQSAQDDGPALQAVTGNANTHQLAPAAQPAPADQKAAPSGERPSGDEPERTSPDQNPGTSRREEPKPTRGFAVAEAIALATPGDRMHARMVRRLA